MNGLPISVRVSAVCLAIGGLIVAVAIPWHPSIFDRPVHDVVHDFAAWTLVHVALLFGVVLAFVGAVGLVGAHQGRLGRLGQVGLVLTLVGMIGAIVLFGVEAIAFPVLAAENPELLAIGGPLLGSPLVIGAALLVLGWPLGLAILGMAAAFARDFNRAPGMALAITAPAFLALSGPFVPIAGALSAIAFGLVQVWWGWLLWRTATHVPIHAGPALDLRQL